MKFGFGWLNTSPFYLIVLVLVLDLLLNVLLKNVNESQKFCFVPVFPLFSFPIPLEMTFYTITTFIFVSNSFLEHPIQGHSHRIWSKNSLRIKSLKNLRKTFQICLMFTNFLEGYSLFKFSAHFSIDFLIPEVIVWRVGYPQSWSEPLVYFLTIIITLWKQLCSHSLFLFLLGTGFK